MNDERGRPTRSDPRGATRMAQSAMPGARESLQPRAAARAPRGRHPSHRLTASIYCEIDGLRVEIEPLELSTAGLFVETPTPLPVDSEVEVFLRIGSVRFEASGTVVQTVSCEEAKTTHRKPGYGLLFTNLDDAGRGVLRRSMEALVFQRANKQRPLPTPRAAEEAPSASRSMPARNSLPAASRPSRPGAAGATTASPSGRAAANSGRPAQRPIVSMPPATRAGGTSAPPVSKSGPASAASAKKPGESVRSAPKSLAPDPQELAVIERLRSELKALDAKTPWAILGVSQGTALAEAKLAFFNASKRYHPHLFARYAAPEIKQLVTQLFIAHKRAFDALKKSSKAAARSSVVDAPRISRPHVSRQPGSGNK